MNNIFHAVVVAVAMWIAPITGAFAQTETYPDTLNAKPDTAVVAEALGGLLTDPAAVHGDPTHRIRPAEWIVPGSAAVLSALCVKTAWGKRVRHEVNEMLGAKESLHTGIDDYLRFVPVAAAYGAYFAGWKGQHCLKDRTILLAMSAATMFAATTASKKIFKEQRPDCDDDNSFPSGHTALAFMGAEFLWQEYRTTHPWVGYAGYGVAALTGYLRLHNKRHWVNDVVAGAAIGVLSTKFAYWLYPKIFKETKGKKHSVAAFGTPFYGNGSAGVNLALVF